MEREDVPTSEAEIVVQVWFGERRRRFRIASLHPFTAALVRSTGAASAVRFCLVGRDCDHRGASGSRCELAPICRAYRPGRGRAKT
jgi:hypothetical protein